MYKYYPNCALGGITFQTSPENDKIQQCSSIILRILWIPTLCINSSLCQQYLFIYNTFSSSLTLHSSHVSQPFRHIYQHMYAYSRLCVNVCIYSVLNPNTLFNYFSIPRTSMFLMFSSLITTTTNFPVE